MKDPNRLGWLNLMLSRLSPAGWAEFQLDTALQSEVKNRCRITNRETKRSEKGKATSASVYFM